MNFYSIQFSSFFSLKIDHSTFFSRQYPSQFLLLHNLLKYFYIIQMYTFIISYNLEGKTMYQVKEITFPVLSKLFANCEIVEPMPGCKSRGAKRSQWARGRAPMQFLIDFSPGNAQSNNGSFSLYFLSC